MRVNVSMGLRVCALPCSTTKVGRKRKEETDLKTELVREKKQKERESEREREDVTNNACQKE